MNLTEKAAYIRGLMEGMELDADKKEVRVLKELLELVSEMASDVEDIGADLSDLYDAVEEIDQDISFIGEEIFGLREDGDFDDDTYEITCPACGETVEMNEEMLFGGDVECPECGERIEIEFDACDCGCEHAHEDEDK